MYTDENTQIIVAVLNDGCDDSCDRFTLKPQRILKDTLGTHSAEESFDVSRPVGDTCWKLQALI
jgi:hypothetical protein